MILFLQCNCTAPANSVEPTHLGHRNGSDPFINSQTP